MSAAHFSRDFSRVFSLSSSLFHSFIFKICEKLQLSRKSPEAPPFRRVSLAARRHQSHRRHLVRFLAAARRRGGVVAARIRQRHHTSLPPAVGLPGRQAGGWPGCRAGARGARCPLLVLLLLLLWVSALSNSLLNSLCCDTVILVWS